MYWHLWRRVQAMHTQNTCAHGRQYPTKHWAPNTFTRTFCRRMHCHQTPRVPTPRWRCTRATGTHWHGLVCSVWNACQRDVERQSSFPNKCTGIIKESKGRRFTRHSTSVVRFAKTTNIKRTKEKALGKVCRIKIDVRRNWVRHAWHIHKHTNGRDFHVKTDSIWNRPRRNRNVSSVFQRRVTHFRVWHCFGIHTCAHGARPVVIKWKRFQCARQPCWGSTSKLNIRHACRNEPGAYRHAACPAWIRIPNESTS